jgi:hypothetical protein
MIFLNCECPAMGNSTGGQLETVEDRAVRRALIRSLRHALIRYLRKEPL